MRNFTSLWFRSEISLSKPQNGIVFILRVKPFSVVPSSLFTPNSRIIVQKQNVSFSKQKIPSVCGWNAGGCDSGRKSPLLCHVSDIVLFWNFCSRSSVAEMSMYTKLQAWSVVIVPEGVVFRVLVNLSILNVSLLIGVYMHGYSLFS